MSYVGELQGSRRVQLSTARPLSQAGCCTAGWLGSTQGVSGCESHVLGKQNSPPADGKKAAGGKNYAVSSTETVTLYCKPDRISALDKKLGRY